MNETCALILLPHLSVENANAVSANLTWGFPAPGAVTGFAHALARQLGDVTLGGVGIVCHDFDPQVAFPDGPWRPGRFRLARHPYIAGWKKFKNEAAAIVEEGKAHLEVTLVIKVLTELEEDEADELAARVASVLPILRLAGGSIRGNRPVEVRIWPEWEEDQRAAFRQLRYRLLPGFTLVERSDLLAKHFQKLHQDDPQISALDAWLDLLALHVEPDSASEEAPVHWQGRSRPGWLVPLPVGYGAISDLYGPGEVANARDPAVPFRFVESLYSIGQWLSPHRLDSLEQMLWRGEADEDAGLYLCRNRYCQSVNEEDLHGEED